VLVYFIKDSMEIVVELVVVLFIQLVLILGFQLFDFKQFRNAKFIK